MLNDIKVDENEKNLNDTIEKDSLMGLEYISDDVKTYLKEINKPLLSTEEERELAWRILEGDSKAKNTLIERNLKLVVYIAKKYIGMGLHILDLIQEGNLGLMIAVDRFDVTKGYKFSTYAFYWIRMAIMRAISEKARNIRISEYSVIMVNKYRQAFSQLQKEQSREPTIEEIANELDLSIEKVTKFYNLQHDTVSLNSLLVDNDDAELEDFITSSEQTPEEKIMELSLQTKVRELLKKCELSDREIKVLKLRNGFNGNDSETLLEIGKKTWNYK